MSFFWKMYFRTKQGSLKSAGANRSTSVPGPAATLPAIIDELKTKDYEDQMVQNFQRVSISGEEMSGVSFL